MISESSRKYTYLWQKYRPAILRLMLDAEKESQAYAFSDHELKAAHPTQAGGYSFVLRMFGTKAVNDIRDSVIAKDLLSVLQGSETAMGLSEKSLYQFEMDRSHTLHVRKEKAPDEPSEERTAPKDDENGTEERRPED